MKYIITGRNIEVTEGLKSAIYEKIGKLERYFTPDTTVYVGLYKDGNPGGQYLALNKKDNNFPINSSCK